MNPPPKAKMVPRELVMHEDVRVDNYHWLRKDSLRTDLASANSHRVNGYKSDVLAHLRKEKLYTAAVMSDVKQLEDHICTEISERINKDDIVGAPCRQGRYYYYERTLAGKEYVQHCRRLVPTDGPITVHDVMPTGPDAPEEHIILDENLKAEGHDYYRIGAFKVSPNNKLVAYAEDTKGDEIYTVYVIDAESGECVGNPLQGITSDIEWAGDDHLLYITKDQGPQLFQQNFTEVSELRLVRPNNKLVAYPKDMEADDMHTVSVTARDIGSHGVGDPYDVSMDNLRPYKVWVKIQDFKLFKNHIAVYELEDGLPKVTVYQLPAIGMQIGRLLGGSMRTPPSVFRYDMDKKDLVLWKTATVFGGFDASNYVTERKWAVADGTRIPISILYRKDLVKLDGSNPMLLNGYGSYEVCNDPKFCVSRFSLVDRGFIYAIAHVRGGGEMGRKWYEDGKLLNKRNTFTDFIACAERLIENKYCSKEKLCINGRSAGGLLMGAVLNMRPNLFKAAVVEVPFVDALTTMLDETLPLTTVEWEEWGDPRIENDYYYIKSYSPVDNVTAQEYPNMLVTAGLRDTCVPYFEPAKFVAKLRELKTDDNLLLFDCDFFAGHFKTGYKKLREDAFIYAFILKALGMTSEVTPSV
ncbi:hypothetical protein ACP70R_043756 [Stipagrostis hirtigluma subsp. patula]